MTREDGPAAKRICLGKQKYVDMPENDFVNAAVMAAGQGNFNASQAQQLAKAARRCGAEGEALAKFTSFDKRKHGNLHRDVLKWLGNMGFEVEPYFLWLPVDSTAADEDGNHGEQLARLPALPIYEVINGIWNLDRAQFKISLLGGHEPAEILSFWKACMEDPAYSNHPSLQDPERLSHMLPIITFVDDAEVYKKQPVLLCVVALRVSDKGKHI